MLNLNSIIEKVTGATSAHKKETIQSLWSGYGSIDRYSLSGSNISSVIIKRISPPSQNDHPRGWNTNLSHQRKLKSYEVEQSWYENFASSCNKQCRIPTCYGIEKSDSETLIFLEDLDSSGFPSRLSSVSWKQIEICLSWFAHFHSTFIHVKPQNLWKTGTYWHLETRPDELVVLDDTLLKKYATAINDDLEGCTYKTLVHGDAKLANFCFSENGEHVSAVDFQYVGGGCGMKDIAYFIGSCLSEQDCEQYETKILDYYFQVLRSAILKSNTTIDINKLEKEWRIMYPTSWADFHRFLKGWSPGHWKINSYSEQIVKKVINRYL